MSNGCLALKHEHAYTDSEIYSGILKDNKNLSDTIISSHIRIYQTNRSSNVMVAFRKRRPIILKRVSSLVSKTKFMPS